MHGEAEGAAGDGTLGLARSQEGVLRRPHPGRRCLHAAPVRVPLSRMCVACVLSALSSSCSALAHAFTWTIADLCRLASRALLGSEDFGATSRSLLLGLFC